MKNIILISDEHFRGTIKNEALAFKWNSYTFTEHTVKMYTECALIYTKIASSWMVTELREKRPLSATLCIQLFTFEASRCEVSTHSSINYTPRLKFE